MSEHQVTAAPDYTKAAVTMLGVNLLWIFFALWVIFGFVPVLVLAVLINHGVTLLSDRLGT